MITPELTLDDGRHGDKQKIVGTNRKQLKGIAEMGNGVPAPEKQNVRSIVSDNMTGAKETAARGKQRRGGQQWKDMRRIQAYMQQRDGTMGEKNTRMVVKAAGGDGSRDAW